MQKLDRMERLGQSAKELRPVSINRPRIALGERHRCGRLCSRGFERLANTEGTGSGADNRRAIRLVYFHPAYRCNFLCAKSGVGSSYSLSPAMAWRKLLANGGAGLDSGRVYRLRASLMLLQESPRSEATRWA